MCFFHTKHLESLFQLDILDGAANSMDFDCGGQGPGEIFDGQLRDGNGWMDEI